jgi:hypothetical protein
MEVRLHICMHAGIGKVSIQVVPSSIVNNKTLRGLKSLSALLVSEYHDLNSIKTVLRETRIPFLCKGVFIPGLY